MKKEWKDAVVTDISVALHVSSGMGIKSRVNRPFHGFVFNAPSGSRKEYRFAGGHVVRMEPGEVCYLPKGTCYHVEAAVSGDCWVIDFDLREPFEEEAFSVSLKNPSAMLELFKEAAETFQFGGEDRELVVRRNIYSMILRLRKEQSYAPGAKMRLIQPALDKINSSFTDRELTVHVLAEQCEISDTYFRKLFGECMGTSPQEYLIDRRIDFAKQLLRNGQFSVSEIAGMCGYNELSHFSREFTRRVGVSPRSYIKTGKAE